MSTQDTGPAVIAAVRRQIVVNASVERAFRVFTEGFGSWWPKSHTISPVPVEQASIEPPDGDRTEVTLVHDEFERHLKAGPELVAQVRDGWDFPLQAFAAATETEPATEPDQPGPPALRYVLTYHSVPGFEPLAQLHFPAHRARLEEFHARGNLLLIGVLEEPVNGDAMAVFASRAAAEEFMAGDPFVLNKVVASWTIRPWREILYQPR